MNYVDGYIIPVPEANKEAFRDLAATAAPIFRDHGALRVVECWCDDVPKGTLTDFWMAVKCETGETVVFSWIEWPSKAVRDEGMKKVMEDPRMKHDMEMPFSGQRMVFGGFMPIIDTSSRKV